MRFSSSSSGAKARATQDECSGNRRSTSSWPGGVMATTAARRSCSSRRRPTRRRRSSVSRSRSRWPWRCAAGGERAQLELAAGGDEDDEHREAGRRPASSARRRSRSWATGWPGGRRSWARAPGRSDGGMACSSTAVRWTPAMRRCGSPTVGHSRWVRSSGRRAFGPITRGSTCRCPTTGRPVHQRGVTGWPGLCLLRLTWQHTRGSALPGLGERRRRVPRSPDRRRRLRSTLTAAHEVAASRSSSTVTSTTRPEELLRRTGKCAERQTGIACRRRELRKLLNPPGPASRPRQA